MIQATMTIEELINLKAPSAGRIIGGITPSKTSFDSIPKNVLEEARKRGTWVHETIEKIIAGEEYDSRWEWEGYIEAFNNFVDDHDISFMATELPIVNRDYTAKGIVDAICTLNGEITLLDFKTSTSTMHVNWELQLMIYAHILSDIGMFDHMDLRVVKLGKDGRYTKLFYQYDPMIAESAINLYHYYLEKGMVKGK